MQFIKIESPLQSIDKLYEKNLCDHNTDDSKVHGAIMGPNWVLSAPVGPHVGSMNFAIYDIYLNVALLKTSINVFVR